VATPRNESLGYLGDSIVMVVAAPPYLQDRIMGSDPELFLFDVSGESARHGVFESKSVPGLFHSGRHPTGSPPTGVARGTHDPTSTVVMASNGGDKMRSDLRFCGVPSRGIEPPTHGLGNRCSIH
jgi:hypothetical protein